MIDYDIHVGDIGTIFEITVQDAGVIMDISSATLMEIKLRKPDGSVSVYNATHTTDGTDGKMRYIVIADTEIDQYGRWGIQSRVVTPQGDWNSSIDTFDVAPNL